MSNATLEVGQPAPDFELQERGGDKVKLSDLRGQKVVISFHPLAFTSVCSRQMLDLELNRDRLAEENAVALGLNVDPAPAKMAWKDSLGIKKTPLLSDSWPHGAVAKSYGIFDDQTGVSRRSVFVVDEEGNLAWWKEYGGSEVPNFDEIMEAVRNA